MITMIFGSTGMESSVRPVSRMRITIMPKSRTEEVMQVLRFILGLILGFIKGLLKNDF